MKIYSIRTLKELKTYRKSWNDILESNENDNPFIEFNWIENWWKYLGEAGSMEVLVLYNDDRIMGFFPLQFSKVFSTTIIEFIGRADASYMDFIVYEEDKETAIYFVLDELMKSFPNTMFHLHGVLSSSSTFTILKNYVAIRKYETSIFSAISPFINVKAINLDDYMNKRKKLNGLNRKERRLRYLGELKTSQVKLEEMEAVFAIHDKHWKNRTDTSHFSEEAYQNFYSALLSNREGPLQTELEGLYLDNQLIAFSYGFLCRGRYIGIVSGHDSDYEIYGPGTILNKDLIAASQKKGLRVFDLGVGYEPYKFEWNTGVDYVNEFIIASKEWQSQMIFHLYKTKGQVKEVLKKNYKIVQLKRKYVDQSIQFVKNASKKEWIQTIRKLSNKIYSHQSIDIYQQEQGTQELVNYDLLDYSDTKRRMYNLSNMHKRYYSGFLPYSDSRFSLFWVQPEVIRVDELDYYEPLPKQSAFVVDWHMHKLPSICTFIRAKQDVQKIYLHTTKTDPHVTEHLQQLGFKHVNRVRKTCVLTLTKTQVIPAVSSKN
ncbi:GNAT family N-acetyltransferase [Paenisporosarcina quisquiliarum]|uniref:GNAT family N-acetyltransferase n=1 Tax=Paenisporosarcina quisquiliarum TaxID=365346 RepID=UPI003734CB6F